MILRFEEHRLRVRNEATSLSSPRTPAEDYADQCNVQAPRERRETVRPPQGATLADLVAALMLAMSGSDETHVRDLRGRIFHLIDGANGPHATLHAAVMAICAVFSARPLSQGRAREHWEQALVGLEGVLEAELEALMRRDV